MMRPEGILYIATGSRYVEEARRSARSIKRLRPDLPVCVITDQKITADHDFDIVLDAEDVRSHNAESYLALDRAAYYRKILPLLQSPFEKTIFLDSDTYVAEPLDDLFRLLDHFDVLVTPAFVTHDYDFERSAQPFSQIPAAFGYFNTGLMAWRRSVATEAFIHRWHKNYEQHVSKHTVNDQPGLRLTLFEGGVNFHVLPTCYNTISWSPFVVPGGGGIVMLHGRNPWLQKWVHRFRTATPLIVGSLSLRHLLLFHAARVLYWVQRRFHNQSGR